MLWQRCMAACTRACPAAASLQWGVAGTGGHTAVLRWPLLLTPVPCCRCHAMNTLSSLDPISCCSIMASMVVCHTSDSGNWGRLGLQASGSLPACHCCQVPAVTKLINGAVGQQTHTRSSNQCAQQQKNLCAGPGNWCHHRRSGQPSPKSRLQLAASGRAHKRMLHADAYKSKSWPAQLKRSAQKQSDKRWEKWPDCYLVTKAPPTSSARTC